MIFEYFCVYLYTKLQVLIHTETGLIRLIKIVNFRVFSNFRFHEQPHISNSHRKPQGHMWRSAKIVFTKSHTSRRPFVQQKCINFTRARALYFCAQCVALRENYLFKFPSFLVFTKGHKSSTLNYSLINTQLILKIRRLAQ